MRWHLRKVKRKIIEFECLSSAWVWWALIFECFASEFCACTGWQEMQRVRETQCAEWTRIVDQFLTDVKLSGKPLCCMSLFEDLSCDPFYSKTFDRKAGSQLQRENHLCRMLQQFWGLKGAEWQRVSWIKCACLTKVFKLFLTSGKLPLAC